MNTPGEFADHYRKPIVNMVSARTPLSDLCKRVAELADCQGGMAICIVYRLIKDGHLLNDGHTSGKNYTEMAVSRGNAIIKNEQAEI